MGGKEDGRREKDGRREGEKRREGGGEEGEMRRGKGRICSFKKKGRRRM